MCGLSPQPIATLLSQFGSRNFGKTFSTGSTSSASLYLRCGIGPKMVWHSFSSPLSSGRVKEPFQPNFFVPQMKLLWDGSVFVLITSFLFVFQFRLLVCNLLFSMLFNPFFKLLLGNFESFTRFPEFVYNICF